MSLANKFSNKVQEVRGRLKRRTGDLTGNPRLQTEGRADQTGADLKQAGEKVKDAFRGRRTRGNRRH